VKPDAKDLSSPKTGLMQVMQEFGQEIIGSGIEKVITISLESDRLL
jgi:hypothetical protein